MKTPKRGHRPEYGQGSFKYDPRMKLWRGRFDTGLKTASGTRRYITASAKNEDEAWQRFQAAKKDFFINGPKLPTVKKGLTVEGWTREWLPTHEQAVRDTTYATDRSNVKNWIIPQIGNAKLEELTAAHMRKVGGAPLKAGRSGSTANSVQRTLTKMLNAAKADGYKIPDSIFAQKKKPLGKSQRTRMSVEEVKAVFDLAYKTHPDAVRFFLAVLYGSRRSEILGLTWDRVHFYDQPGADAVVVGEMDLSKQVRPLRYLDRAAGTFHIKEGEEHLVEHLAGRWHFTPTKTAAGERVLPMIAPVAVELRKWQAACPPGAENPFNLVFPRLEWRNSEYAGHPRNFHDDGKQWRDLQHRAGVYKREPSGDDPGEFYVLHEARHSMISMLRDAGVSKHIIEMLVGQTSLVESYTHSELEAAGEAVGLLAGLLPSQ